MMMMWVGVHLYVCLCAYFAIACSDYDWNQIDTVWLWPFLIKDITGTLHHKLTTFFTRNKTTAHACNISPLQYRKYTVYTCILIRYVLIFNVLWRYYHAWLYLLDSSRTLLLLIPVQAFHVLQLTLWNVVYENEYINIWKNCFMRALNEIASPFQSHPYISPPFLASPTPCPCVDQCSKSSLSIYQHPWPWC